MFKSHGTSFNKYLSLILDRQSGTHLVHSQLFAGGSCVMCGQLTVEHILTIHSDLEKF